MTTPVNPRLSKLLKEKGFDVEDRTKYQMYGSQVVPQLEPYDDIKWDIYKDYCLAPTIGDVVMWVYEKHGIWIKVECPENSVNNDWVSYIHKVGKYECLYASHIVNSPTKAYEAAIEYVLKNLI